VLNKGEDSLSVIEPNGGHEKERWKTGHGPHEIAISARGERAVVCNYGDQTPGSTLSVYDLEEGRLEKVIDLAPHQRPHGIAFLDNRTRCLVTSETSRAVLEVDVVRGKILRVLETGAELSHMLALARGKQRVYTANIKSGSVSAIDLESGKQVGSVATGNQPEAIDVSPDGREVWVGHNADGKIVVLDARTLEKQAEIACGPLPIRLAFAPDGKRVLVSCAAAGEVVVLDAVQRTELARIPLARLAQAVPSGPNGQTSDNPVPVGILFEPRGAFAFVAATAAGRVDVIDMATLTVKTSIPVGKNPDGLAWGYRRHAAGDAFLDRER
jgi:YVTN family beta-propeller protein